MREIFFLNFFKNIFMKIKKKICPQKVEKTTPKSCILMAIGRFFLWSPDCPKQPRTSFLFYKFFIQPSLLESLVNANLKMFSTRSKKECSNSFSTSNFSFRKSDSWSRCVMHQRPYNFYLIIYLKVFRTERYDVG